MTVHVTAALLGCRADLSSLDPSADRLRVVQGAPAFALPGYPLYDSIKVSVLDGEGQAVAGQTVQWLPSSGTVRGDAVTNEEGIAAAEWVLGPDPGVQVLRVRSILDSVQEVSVKARYFTPEKVSSSYTHGCALLHGDIWCWGREFLANDPPVSRYSHEIVSPFSFRPKRVSSGMAFVDLRLVSGDMICGITAAGTVTCFLPAFGVITQQAIAVPPLQGLMSTATRSGYMCGLAVSDSTPWCWSRHSGVAPRPAGLVPMLDLGGFNTWAPFGICGRAADSTAVCWDETARKLMPVPGARRFTEVVAQGTAACGRTAANEVWCWGGPNNNWILGRPSSGSLTPVLVTDSVSAIAAEDYTILVTRKGRMIRWGSYFDVGLHEVPGFNYQFSILNPNTISCARRADGALFCQEEHWNNWTGIHVDRFFPVQPVEAP